MGRATFVAAIICACAGQETCSQFCQNNGKGLGHIIGTAPFCGGDCGGDCPYGYCTIASSSMSDYGNECGTGNKVCCCENSVEPPANSTAPLVKAAVKIQAWLTV